MKHLLVGLVPLVMALSGCTVGVPDGFSWEDSDLDGIPDDIEEHLAGNCVLFDQVCVDMGLSPPVVGERDLVIVEVSRSGPDQDWRLDSAVWDAFMAQADALGLRVQRVDLGVRDDIGAQTVFSIGTDTRDFWDDFSWFHVLAYDAEQKDFYAESHGAWILMADHDGPESQTATLLHEFYHAFLGSLEDPSTHSECDDDSHGGTYHSNDPESLLYVDAACNSQDDLGLHAMTPSEQEEFEAHPIDSLRWLNHPCWWDAHEGPATGTPCSDG